MCMEDVKIGRASSDRQTIVTVTTTPILLVGADEKRISVIISGSYGHRLTLGFDSSVSDGSGIVLFVGGATLIFG